MTTSRTYYISSGRLDAMYTLRVEIGTKGHIADNYICNLSTDPDKAEAKARDYFDRLNTRIGEGVNMVFAGYADFSLNTRRGRLSVVQTEQIEMVERGIMPFGKYSGRKIESLDEGYVLWWADKIADHEAVVVTAIISFCQGVAMDKGYIQARQARIDEKIAASNYLGEVGKRMEFEGVVEFVKALPPIQVAWNTWAEKYMVVISCDGNQVVYFGGSAFADKGQHIKFKGTVKDHKEHQGIKQTVIQRPKLEMCYEQDE